MTGFVIVGRTDLMADFIYDDSCYDYVKLLNLYRTEIIYVQWFTLYP